MKLTNKFGDVVEIIAERGATDDEGIFTHRCQKFDMHPKTGSISGSWMYGEDPAELVKQVADEMRKAGWA